MSGKRKERSFRLKILMVFKSFWFGIYKLLGVVFISAVILLAVGLIYRLLSRDIVVIEGDSLDKEYVEFIRENKLIDDSEEILFWYSGARFDFKDSFYFCTEKNVVMYGQDWEPKLIKVCLGGIKDIKLEKLDPVAPSIIVLMLHKEPNQAIFISYENGSDEVFYKKLKELLKQYRAENPIEVEESVEENKRSENEAE